MFRLLIAAMAVESSPRSAPLGAATVAVALLGALGGGLKLEILECRPGSAGEELASTLGRGAPDAVGFSIYSWNRAVFRAAARALRASAPDLVLFAGGPEATADPTRILAEGDLDFLVVGEGESAAVAAISAILEASARGPRGRAALSAAGEALAAIPGVRLSSSFGDQAPGRRISVVGGFPGRSPAEDPARLVSPWLSGLLDPARYDEVLWELTRGCPYRCAYCYESKGQPGLRPFPPERLEAELELFARSGVSQVFVLDPTFDADRPRAEAILDLIRAKGRDIRWKFEVRAELLDRSLIRRFAGLSCSLQIGLQSADPAVLALVGRDLDRDIFRRKIGMLNAAGITFGLDLIFGLPGEGYAGLRRSLDFALALQPNHLDLFPLALLPGTELADRAAELGLEADPEPPYLVRSTRELSPDRLAEAAALAEACDLFYSRGRAVSWFLQALRPLKVQPSAFLERFANWRTVRAASATSAGTGGAARAGTDIAGAAAGIAASAGPGGAARAGATGPGALPQRRIEELQLAFLEECYRSAGLGRLLPALRDIVRFNGAWGRAIAEGESEELDLAYDPEEVLGPGALDLAAFARGAKPRPSLVRVGPAPGGEVEVLRLSPPRRAKSGSPGTAHSRPGSGMPSRPRRAGPGTPSAS